MYIRHIQGLCQFRLSTADHALLLVAHATTAVDVYSLERSYDRPPPSLSLLYFLCRCSPCPMLRTFAVSPCFLSVHIEYFIRDGYQRKHRVEQFFCCVCIRCHGNVFTEPLPRKCRQGLGIHFPAAKNTRTQQ
jgi:hypothetical protein